MTEQKTAEQKQNTTVNLDKAIIVRSKDGSEIRRIKTQMKMSVRDGSLVKILPAKKAWKDRPAEHATFIPTANCFMAMAAKCGLAIRHPDKVTVGGIEQPNGYCDDRGTYYFRAQAGGYTANGQPFITDRTVDFNVHRYNIQDLLAKAKQDENARYFQMLPFEGKDEKTGAILGRPDKGWAGYQIDEAVVLWVNCAAPDFVKWAGEMNNRIKNAIRVAQTFADRNAISAHPALPMQKKFQLPGDAMGVQTAVECVSWFATKGMMTFRALEDEGHVEVDTAAASITDDEEAGRVIDATIAAEAHDASDASQVEEPADEPGEASQEAQEGHQEASHGTGAPEGESEPPEEREDGVGRVTGIVEKVTKKDGKKKDGSGWIRYTVTVGGTSYSTFDAKLGNVAHDLESREVVLTFEDDGKYKTLKAIDPMPGQATGKPVGQKAPSATGEAKESLDTIQKEVETFEADMLADSPTLLKVRKAVGLSPGDKLDRCDRDTLTAMRAMYRSAPM